MRNPSEIIKIAEQKAAVQFKEIEEIALYNQNKVLKAFQKNKIALRHFNQSTGYGYGDDGRDTLCNLFADVFGGESGLVSPNILSGTHALTVSLFGLLRPNDLMLSVTGKPYDTLIDVINGADGSLHDFGVKYDEIEMIGDNIDINKCINYLSNNKVKLIYIQRSRGYTSRNAITISQISDIVAKIKQIDKKIIVMVDNCYGEFVEKIEPTEVGVDVIVGSLIKNPGAGIVPTGGYIIGKKQYIDKIAGRLTSPSVGAEVGSYSLGYQYFYQGLFLAPHVVSQALKGSVLFGYALNELGYTTFPAPQEKCGDIIRSVKLNNGEELVSFIQAIQSFSPVDSFLTLEPWDMPGYDSKVVMAAGCFVQGASIELSADSPIKPPYIAYLQGGLTYEHCKIAALQCVSALLKDN